MRSFCFCWKQDKQGMLIKLDAQDVLVVSDVPVELVVYTSIVRTMATMTI